MQPDKDAGLLSSIAEIHAVEYGGSIKIYTIFLKQLIISILNDF